MIKSYDEMSKVLSNEQEELFDKHLENEALFAELIRLNTYTNGVKLGMSLILEILNFEPTFEK